MVPSCYVMLCLSAARRSHGLGATVVRTAHRQRRAGSGDGALWPWPPRCGVRLLCECDTRPWARRARGRGLSCCACGLTDRDDRCVGAERVPDILPDGPCASAQRERERVPVAHARSCVGGCVAETFAETRCWCGPPSSPRVPLQSRLAHLGTHPSSHALGLCLFGYDTRTYTPAMVVVHACAVRGLASLALGS